MNQVKKEELSPPVSVGPSFNFPSMSMPTTVLPQLVPTGYVYLQDGLNFLLNDNIGNPNACQQPSSLPQGEDGNKAQSSRSSKEDVLQKRVHSLRKNREAARMSRQRRKKYIATLENRFVQLENENKILTEEIEAIKRLHGHKD